jgi:hypothetical protein
MRISPGQPLALRLSGGSLICRPIACSLHYSISCINWVIAVDSPDSFRPFQVFSLSLFLSLFLSFSSLLFFVLDLPTGLDAHHRVYSTPRPVPKPQTVARPSPAQLACIIIYIHTQSGIILNSSRSRPSCTTCTNLARPIAALPICAVSSHLSSRSIHILTLSRCQHLRTTHPHPIGKLCFLLKNPPQRKRHLSIVICSISPSSLPFSSPSFFSFSRIRPASLPPRSQPAGCWCTVLYIGTVLYLQSRCRAPTRKKGWKGKSKHRSPLSGQIRWEHILFSPRTVDGTVSRWHIPSHVTPSRTQHSTAQPAGFVCHDLPLPLRHHCHHKYSTR